ncbi:hypothetical protein BGZ47_007170 [Haplosporangium gracile]|nr:hypothetical protein BGZ47_007170 [Haplosporangium gracile]
MNSSSKLRLKRPGKKSRPSGKPSKAPYAPIDADFTVYNFVSSGGKLIHGLARILRAAGYVPITTIANARVPIVSFVKHNIHCDMSINQPMGVLNSQLINAYQRIDSRFLGLWFDLRTLAEKHGIGSGNAAYLSPYALTMMLIVFLQDVTTPPILPRFQQQGANKMFASLVDGLHCAYDRNPRNYTAMAARNTKSEGQLLTELCQYFGYTFDYLKQEVNPRFGVIRNRSVSTPPRSKMDNRPKDWSICILDPFIPSRNVAGNCRHNHVVDIQQAFRSAYDALKTSQDLAEVYDHIRKTYQYNSVCFNFPCDHNIYLHQFNIVNGLRTYLNRLGNKHGPLYPYQTFVQSWYVDSPVDDAFIFLLPLRPREIQDFLRQYVVTIPHTYHDDIVVLIEAVREHVWRDGGSGGGYYVLDNGIRGATKFSKVYNANKRVKSSQLQADELTAQRQRQRRQQQIKAEKQKQEQERKRQEDEARSKTRLELDNKCREFSHASRADLQHHSDDKNVKVGIFGSFASGLCSITSEVDFTVYNFARRYRDPIIELVKAPR